MFGYKEAILDLGKCTLMIMLMSAKFYHPQSEMTFYVMVNIRREIQK